jgi:hypothetical protein
VQGRAEFTQAEMDEIRRIVRLKTGASVSRQKQLRQHLRTLEFFITDFGYQGHGFREADLDRLLAKGQVRITDGHIEEAGLLGRLRRALRRWWS